MKGLYVERGELLELSGNTFPVKDQIKALGGRWDAGKKIWVVRKSPDAIEALMALGFVAMTAKDGSVVAPGDSTLAALAPATPSVPATDSRERTWSVGEFVSFVEGVIARYVAEDYWIAGDISSLRVSNGHSYFELAESADEIDSTRLRRPAAVACVLWAGTRKALTDKYGSLPLEEGLKVRLRVHCEFRREGGRLALVVQDLDLAYTMGDLALMRQRVVAELRKRGLYDRNRRLRLPPLPLRIALITAAGSRAQSDFLDELRTSGIAFSVVLIDSHVQGELTSAEVCRAFQMVAARNDVDCVVLTRGGGSRLDLRWFDDLEIGKAIAYSAVPVITAIGHFEDVSIADEVAFLAEKTPTGAARFLANHVAVTWKEVEERVERMSRVVARRIERERTLIAGFDARLVAAVRRSLARETTMLAAVEERLGGAARRTLANERRRLEGLAQSLRIMRASLENSLRRGFALARARDGQVLRAESFLEAGRPDEFTLEMRTAERTVQVRCKVLEVKSSEERTDGHGEVS